MLAALHVGRDGGAAFLQQLEVNVLPLVQFYANGKRVEAFPCGPRKIELLREKLEKWHNWYHQKMVEIVEPEKAEKVSLGRQDGVLVVGKDVYPSSAMDNVKHDSSQ